MVLTSVYRLCSKRISVKKQFCASFSKLAVDEKSKNQPIISCRRKEYDFYHGQTYSSIDTITLASKGWNHSKSNGDYFVVHPNHNVYKLDPGKKFDEFDMHPNLIAALKEQDIDTSTQVQEEAFNVIREKKHALIAAETGCGKTIAYLLPIIQNLLLNSKPSEQLNTPRALILCPNRELAYQIGTVAKNFAQSVGLESEILVGGNTKRLMLNPTFSPVDLLIGTPGVIGKLSSVGVYRLHSVESVVLDEADTLMDDSFTDRMPALMQRIGLESQCILVSATLPRIFPDFMEGFRDKLIHITSPLLHKPLHNVTQRFLKLTRSGKPPQLLQIAKNEKNPLLVFSNRNKTCDWIALFLNENGIGCSNINGGMNSAIRIEQWNRFVSGETKILSATDVGSRGLDTTQIKHVINYDFPLYAADYLHRIGRTGRFGSPDFCKITNFVSGPEEVALVQQIEYAIRRNEALPNVDGNITKIVQRKIQRKIREQSA